MITQEEYYRIYNSAVDVVEWNVEDIEKNSIVQFPANKTFLQHFAEEKPINKNIFFNIFNEEKKTIRGLIMRSGEFIPRTDINGKGQQGYIYFSKESIRKMHSMFFSDRLTIDHADDITGDAILVKSWLTENYDLNGSWLEWWAEYKIQTKNYGNTLKLFLLVFQ